MSLTPQTMSKGGRLRRLFTSTSPVPTSSTPTNAQTALQGSADLRNTSGILTDSLERFAAKDKSKVRSLEPANVIGVDAAIAGVYTYANELQQLCAKTRLSWNYKAHQIYLLDQVDKIVHYLDKIKSARDIVADMNPAYAGLPWAEVRAILEVCAPHEVGFCLQAEQQ
jgi:hypothetical protein